MNLIRNAVFKILKRIGTDRIKTRVWDKEYRNGKWNYLEQTLAMPSKDILSYYLEKRCGDGTILDLGCGTGKTGLELDLKGYSY